MATHPGMLLAYDEAGNVLATLDYKVAYADDLDRTPLGLEDFAGHEEAGGEMTDVWKVVQLDEGGVERPAKGSKVWPEYLGSQAYDYRVELGGPAGGKRIAALVHKENGSRRDRAAIEAAIATRIAEAAGGAADIRDIVGGPDRPVVVAAVKAFQGKARRVPVAKAVMDGGHSSR